MKLLLHLQTAFQQLGFKMQLLAEVEIFISIFHNG